MIPNPLSSPLEVTENRSHSTPSGQGQARIAVRTEEEQQAAAKERARHELLAHKDARRKSLGMSMDAFRAIIIDLLLISRKFMAND